MGSTGKRQHVIGFDLGGTKMLAAVIDSKDRIIGRSKQKTGAGDDPEAIFSRIVETIENALKDAGTKAEKLCGIGVGSPGPVDIETGTILDTPNVNLRFFPLKKRLEEHFGCPALLENDVNAGTYGEFRFGAGKGNKHVLGVFPGTGIGGGLVLDGKLYHGATGAAGEVGHMIIQVHGPLCGCGQYGCLESLASRNVMGKDAVFLAAGGEAPTVLEEAGTDLKRVTSKVFKASVKNDDKAIIKLVERSATYLGIGMANLVNILSPEVIIIGGGLVEKLGGFYLETAEASMREHAMPFLVEHVKVVEATLGDDAGVLGAATLLRESLER